MKTIYLVSSGQYSDYSVHALFSTKELAELYIESHLRAAKHPDDVGIEEYILDKNERSLRKGHTLHIVRMTKEGHVLECEVRDFAPHHHLDGQGNLFMSMYAKDKQHAIKIANETRTRLIAENNWK